MSQFTSQPVLNQHLLPHHVMLMDLQKEKNFTSIWILFTDLHGLAVFSAASQGGQGHGGMKELWPEPVSESRALTPACTGLCC